MANPVAEIFRTCVQLLVTCPKRRGNCLFFEPGDEVIYAGDIHGHRGNLTKIINFAQLGSHPNRRLVLQEIIHGGPADQAGADRSVDLLLRAVRLKISYPGQVHFLLANHDLAQCTGNEITKDGRGVCKAFEQGLEQTFGPESAEVQGALYEMLLSTPLAARCPNGVLMSHSLPAPERMSLVDWSILERPYQDSDFARGGTVYEWVWGRRHLAEQLDEIAQRLGASFFLLGHQPRDEGYEVVDGRAAILDSNHANGCIAIFSAGEAISPDSLSGRIRRIASL